MISNLPFSLFQLIPILVDSLFVLSEDILNKDIVYCILLVLSGIMTDKKRKGLFFTFFPKRYI